jgi:hypothetical protein
MNSNPKQEQYRKMYFEMKKFILESDDNYWVERVREKIDETFGSFKHWNYKNRKIKKGEKSFIFDREPIFANFQLCPLVYSDYSEMDELLGTDHFGVLK